MNTRDLRPGDPIKAGPVVGTFVRCERDWVIIRTSRLEFEVAYPAKDCERVDFVRDMLTMTRREIEARASADAWNFDFPDEIHVHARLTGEPSARDHLCVRYQYAEGAKVGMGYRLVKVAG